MNEFVEWLKQSWVLLVAVISGITLIYNFYKNVIKNMKNDIQQPFNKINEQIKEIKETLEENKVDAKLMKESLLSMQRRSLLEQCETYLKLGYATVEQCQTLNAQLKSYHDLGGNSFISEMVQKVNDLPFEKPEKKSKKGKELLVE